MIDCSLLGVSVMKHILNISKHLLLAGLVTGIFIEKAACFLVVAGLVVFVIFIVGRIKRCASPMDPVMVTKAQADANEYGEESNKATF